MAYWVQDTDVDNNMGRKSLYCDFLADIDKLPTHKKEGVKQEDDSTASNTCVYGSSCLCLEDTSVWILGKETDEWKRIN